MQICLLCSLTSQFCNTCNSLPLLFRLLYLLQHYIGNIGILMEIVIYLSLYKVSNEFIDTWAARVHICRTSLHLGLALKKRLFNIYRYCSNKSVTYIRIVEVFIEIFLDSPCNMLLESTLVGTTLSSMLTINKGIIFLSILAGMSEGNLNILAFEVYYRIKTSRCHIIIEEIDETIS